MKALSLMDSVGRRRTPIFCSGKTINTHKHIVCSQRVCVCVLWLAAALQVFDWCLFDPVGNSNSHFMHLPPRQPIPHPPVASSPLLQAPHTPTPHFPQTPHPPPPPPPLHDTWSRTRVIYYCRVGRAATPREKWWFCESVVRKMNKSWKLRSFQQSRQAERIRPAERGKRKLKLSSRFMAQLKQHIQQHISFIT